MACNLSQTAQLLPNCEQEYRSTAFVGGDIRHIAVESESPATIFSPLAVCQNDCARGFTKGNVLLVEPAMVPRSKREELLSTAKYCVTAVSDIHDVIVLRVERPIAVAVLSDVLGSLRLRVAAESVRRQWPEAKILILGCGGPALEDQLYDEVVSHWHEATALLEVLQVLAENRWTKSMSADHAAWGSFRHFQQQPDARRRRFLVVSPSIVEMGDGLSYENHLSVHE